MSICWHISCSSWKFTYILKFDDAVTETDCFPSFKTGLKIVCKC